MFHESSIESYSVGILIKSNKAETTMKYDKILTLTFLILLDRLEYIDLL